MSFVRSTEATRRKRRQTATRRKTSRHVVWATASLAIVGWMVHQPVDGFTTTCGLSREISTSSRYATKRLVSISSPSNIPTACDKEENLGGMGNNQSTAYDSQNNSDGSGVESSGNGNGTSRLSRAAIWHQQRRKAMIAKYGRQILDLEQESSQCVGIPLLLLGNSILLGLSIVAGSMSSIPAIVAMAIFPGSILSLWQLQILHDCLHGTLLDKKSNTFLLGNKNNKSIWQHRILFWGSLPCVFGYYLYLQYGHLAHHKSVGSEQASLQQLFDSSQVDFEDGDVLFVSHRMKLKGPIGPQLPIPQLFWKDNAMNVAEAEKEEDESSSSSSSSSLSSSSPSRRRFPLSISRSGFSLWKMDQPVWNAIMFAASFLFERYLLCWNDVVVAVTGRNFFFPNKPAEFHRQCTNYTRAAVALRVTLYLLAGWKSLLFLYLSETLWSIPPHPACAMFITNHGSKIDETNDGGCEPSSSTYAGAWYSALTLGTNYHCEHHDFPSIPFHRLSELHQIAPEFYPSSSQALSSSSSSSSRRRKDNVFEIMKETFAKPDFYACSNANQLQEYPQEKRP